MRRGRHRVRWLRRAAWIIAAPFLLVAFVLSLPIVLPFVGLAEARTERRKRAAIERQRCDWCVARLDAAALTRADALYAAYVAKVHAEDDTLFHRLVRDVHACCACCARCDACYGYDERADWFVPLPVRRATAMYAGLIERAVEPATAAMAWPWLGPHAPLHPVALTRDTIANDVDSPHAGQVDVLATADAAAIAEALLRSPWLTGAGSDATWRCSAGPVALVFGLRAGMPFVTRTGDEAVRSDRIAAVHLRPEAPRAIDGI